MLKLYSEKAAERIIARYAAWIETLSARYAMPGACLKAILFSELTAIDALDPLADALVRFNQRRAGTGSVGTRGIFGKTDSSTGYAQIFAFVAINAVNFAADRGLTSYAALGLPADHRLDPASLPDLRLVWGRLHREPEFNLEAAALNLLSAAEEMTGRIDFASCSPEELKLIFTRYNGSFRDVSPYGEAAYRHYLRYLGA